MRRILIVDDEEPILRSLRRLFVHIPCVAGSDKTYQLVVDAYSTPEEALNQARHTPYDLVISDYRMPNMNGVQFLKKFRVIQPDAVRTVLSGYADLNGLIEAINEAGISRFIAKPWNDYEFVSTIGQSLALRDLAIENQRLADQTRLTMGTITPQEMELKRLEEEEYGITQVIWGPDGSFMLDESLLDPEDRKRL